MDDVFTICWLSDGKYRYIDKRGIGDVSEFVRNSDAYGRRIISIKNRTFDTETGD